ncbi:S-adenosylmethionine:tRNA ribosyltransferase-isomerase [Phycisphaerae bacterium RAS1]|nr:S-adenosylmethionine:tRNA ribosyltransferase-isomerase [Phycisphaerae bacterium RAS1]
MHLRDLHYDLPPELIAQQPLEPRDASRLLVVHRASGRLEHRRFRDVAEFLRPGDCLVLNNTRVIPARFFARRASGGRVEGLFLRKSEGDGWRALLKPAARIRVGESLVAEGADVRLRVVERHDRGEFALTNDPPADPIALLAEIGRTPLPPYIRRDHSQRAGVDSAERADAQRYQTVYASAPGAVAAPTAGLHFTPELLATLAAGGVKTAEITLHVGLGTFAPIEVEDLSQHRLHSEYFEASPGALSALHAARGGGGRIVAVGTTSCRTLETLARRGDPPPGAPREPLGGWTDLFIRPPFEFRLVEVLLTNFHLPGSSLVALVMAFAGESLIRQAYQAAIAERYRFYSYGDAMLVV